VNVNGKAIQGYLWAKDIDMRGCQGPKTRAVTITMTATNQPGNSKCPNHDWDKDGERDCDLITGFLLAGSSNPTPDLGTTPPTPDLGAPPTCGPCTGFQHAQPPNGCGGSSP
jgi:hypothetical protein